jgi:hypothetical protein
VPQLDTTIETSLAPEAVRAALIDFSERRPEIWPGVTPELYEVYSVGETSADVKEGTRLPWGPFWARERYDWSDPDTVRWTVVESNFSEPGTQISAALRRREDGGTRIELHWERKGSTLLGKLAARMIALTNGKPVTASFEKALRRLEAAS